MAFSTWAESIGGFMGKRPIINNQFDGGWSIGKKYGLKNSFNYSRSLNFRVDPSQLTLLGQPAREDNNTVIDLVQNEVMTDSGDIYALGDKGYVYKRTSNGTWSGVGRIDDGAYGISYRRDQDSIYFASSTSVSLYNPLSGSPALSPGFYGASISEYNNSDQAGFNVSAFQNSGTLSTTIATSVSESETARRYFQTDIEPLRSVSVQVRAKGTGDWTAVLHDGLNNQLATATVTNSNLSNGQWAEFVFSDQVRVNVAPAAQTYHVHITSTVADGSVYSTSPNDLSSCNFQLSADRLVDSQNGMHPMVNFLNYVLIGNERYLSAWEPLGDPTPSNTEWQRHKLQFPSGWQVCGIDTTNEYAVIACEKISTGDNTPQEGILFFWDGVQQANSTEYGQYNYFVRIPEGAPYGLHTYKNVIYYEAGGAWYALSSIDSQPHKIRTLPNGESSYAQDNNKTSIYPYGATTRNGIQLMAWPSYTTNTELEYGVYSWGQVDVNFPNSFAYSYPLSTGSRFKNNTNNLTIGMVKNFGDTLHISWRDDDNGGYGVDVVNSESDVASFASWESIVYDMGYPGKLKEGDYMNATWLPLPDGVEIQFKYSINRGDWIYSERFSNTNTWLNGDGYMNFSIGQSTEQGRFYEFQMGFDVYSAEGVTESPTITSVTLIYDDMSKERLDNA